MAMAERGRHETLHRRIASVGAPAPFLPNLSNTMAVHRRRRRLILSVLRHAYSYGDTMFACTTSRQDLGQSVRASVLHIASVGRLLSIVRRPQSLQPLRAGILQPSSR